MQRIFHTPEGVRDIYNGECSQKHHLQTEIRKVFDSYGYEEIETPSFEYFEVFSREVGTIPSKDLYKFFDREGNTLVLRPDFTPSVSRACATYFNPEHQVITLSYTGNTFINNSSYQGRLKETTQMGVERIGDDSAEADAELLAMTVECLLKAGLKEFQVSVGQVDYFKSLLQDANLDIEEEENLRSLISQKNYFGVEDLVRSQNIPESLEKAFLELPHLFGSSEILQKARSLTDNICAIKAVERLEEIYEILKIYGYEKYVSFDFGMLSKFQYYTGIIFQAYTYGTGEPVVKGGRYNNLLKHFGKPAASIGFGITVDNLLMALSRQKISLPEKKAPVILTYTEANRREAILEAQKLRNEGTAVALRRERRTADMRYLTVALTKGRLAQKTLDMFEQIGITCEEMRDKDTRKLIFVNEDLKLRFFLAKGPDVPTYVEYGAADIGVTGKDIILEEGRKLYEVMDLGFGKCRMCVCGPESARELLQNNQLIRVATKYPNIAKDYFYNKKHQTVEIIKLNGSIELAPIVGLSEVIVDIVETGSTLRENGLNVLEEVCPLSARMVVNQVSMKMEDERIRNLIRDLRNVISK